MTKFSLAAAVAAACLALPGCTTAVSQAAAAGEEQAQERVFPEPERAWLKDGTFPNRDSLRTVAPGMSKDQLYHLLGRPHFGEGLWGVREWNYIFHLRTGKGAEYITCQYMVRFDDKELSVGGWWKEPQCAALVAPPIVVEPIPVAAAPVAPKKITLSADGLFRFDRASVDDLLPGGREDIERLGRSIKNNFRNERVVVTGHTDRLGSAAYNDALSRSRAEAVRELLVRQGIAAGAVVAVGKGEREPVVTDCVGERPTPQLLKCLQPNRRVEIEVSGEQ